MGSAAGARAGQSVGSLGQSVGSLQVGIRGLRIQHVSEGMRRTALVRSSPGGAKREKVGGHCRSGPMREKGAQLPAPLPMRSCHLTTSVDHGP